VAAAEVDAMVRTLPSGGGDAWAAGCIGVGPVAGYDAARQLVVTGDLRLTNAAGIMATLQLPPRPSPTSAEIVLAAYRQWGEDLPEHLLGDFSFALWDGRRRRLLCARDPFGVKPFYFHLDRRRMAFASDADALLAIPDVPRRLNAQAIAEYLAASFDDTAATGFLDVSRLAPGQALVVDAERSTLRTYWSPDPSTELRLSSDADYEEAFRHTLTAAVASRMGKGTVGVSLSGGLDSSSLTCVASRVSTRPLHAYTAVFDADPASDERVWSSAVIERCGAIGRPCNPGETSPLADWAGASWKGAAPAGNAQISVCRATLEAAAADGVPVVLHGFGGDSVVSHGLAYLTQLVGSGHLLRATAEAGALGRRHATTRRRLARNYAVAPFVPDAARRAWLRARGRPAVAPPDLLRPEVVRRFELGRPTGPTRARTAREGHVASMTAGIIGHALEASHRVDAVVGVERRYPFFDRPLVELCLSLPGDQKLRQGWTRSIMRRALADLLPPEVLQRPGKGNLAPGFRRALATTDRAALQALVARPGRLEEWIDRTTLTGLWQRCQEGGRDRDWFALWRAAVAGRWLCHHGFDDPPPGIPG
jgi:asparagine synthase (glutamine-hydrolysing)